MNIKDFTENAQILTILADLESRNIQNKLFSDITDDEGFQYVDLVMEGGGVLGVALVGYLYVLEQMRIRFLALAGTSAGAINTMILAAGGPINEAKSEWMLECLCSKNLFDFVDGDKSVKNFISSIIDKKGQLDLIFKSVFILDEIKNHIGLNPGDNFHNWLKILLKEKGVETTEQLQQVRQIVPKGLKNIDGKIYDATRIETIAIVAADIVTETKVEFPKMAYLYWEDWKQTNPADYVRASMSIPVFFYPFKVSNIPQGKTAWENWNKCTGYSGDVPKEVVFTDGGTMSNFPIDIFHNHFKVPSAPTFGIKLGSERTKPNEIKNILSYAGAVFDAARHVHDYDFIMRNPDYKKLVGIIEIGDHNWLNFNLTDKDKIDLFVRGARKAAEFLIGFDWEGYKAIREALIPAYDKSVTSNIKATI